LAWARAAKAMISSPTWSALIASSGRSRSTRRDRHRLMTLFSRARADNWSLVRDPAGHVLQVVASRLLTGDRGVKDHLQQQITQLLAEQLTVAGLDGLNRLGGLLDQVLHQRAMRLLGIPRATFTQPGHHLDQALHLG
jgi:hypothetical protein